MPNPNGTSPFVCKFLSEENFSLAHQKFVEAFSDYMFRFQLSERLFRNHIVLNGVDLSRSMGCFDNGELVGLSLNGFGEWNGLPTVYDAGTGVVPSHRKRGISEAMFQMMLPIFKDQGYRQCLLEVITENEPAIKLYEKLGFERIRTLYLMQAENLEPIAAISDGIEFRDVKTLDLPHLCSFAEGRPSWQNSWAAIGRTLPLRRIIGAFEGEQCVGFIAYATGVGRISQIAVHPEYRRRGVADRLLDAMRADTPPGHKPQVINIDAAITDAVEFFRRRGFEIILRQYEMRKLL